jgi:hypothetical protein
MTTQRQSHALIVPHAFLEKFWSGIEILKLLAHRMSMEEVHLTEYHSSSQR